MGTTNSACSIWRDGKSQLIPNRLGKDLTPSIVSIDADGVLSVGEIAKNRLVSHPKSTVAVFKRLMGTEQTLKLNNRSFTAIELSSLVLTGLKEDAQAFLGENISEAVISVPAYFNDRQRKATKLAAELAGLKVERLINEPTAAALVYGLQEQSDGSQYLVLDLGGGTFDVSLVEYFDGVIEVHASAGDNFLGGENFLELLVRNFLKESKLDRDDLSKEENQRVNREVEGAMHQLSREHSVELTDVVSKQLEPWLMTRDKLAVLAKPLLERIKLPVEKTIRDSNVALHEIDDIILVGGATRLSCVKSLISRMFRRLPRSEIDPDKVVALGAGVQAGLREKQSDLDDVVLTDVAPYSLGVGIVNHQDSSGRDGNIFHPIIERNTVVPVSIEHRLYTAEKGQAHIATEVYQGESRLVKNNVYLGELEIPVPKNTEDHEPIDVRFSYDMNGLLEVDVTVVKTTEKFHLMIENSSGGLSEADIQESRKKLAKMKFHPRDDEQNRLLLARAERFYESSNRERREQIGYEIGQFTGALDTQDDRQISAAKKRFEEMLSALENESLF